jgi:hypothetical protein
MKRPTLLAQVAAGLTAGSAHRQIARSTRSSKTSVTRIAERLGRHAALFHSRALASGIRIREPVVHDHFETFIGRQDHALGGGTAVGARSWFVYDVDPAPHRGSGRRPDRQAKEPETVSTPYVSSIRRTVAGLLELLPTEGPLHLIADGRADYRFALRRKDLGGRIVLHAYPNPKRGPKGTPRSAEAIARDAAMFPVDSLHQFVRHTCADHKRETIAFGRRLESIIGRLQLMAVWKNFIKGRSERAPDRTTPAMRMGLAEEPWDWARVLSRRLFPTREALSDSQTRLYFKRWTPRLPELRRSHAV